MTSRKRKNVKLRKALRSDPCVVCNATPSDVHHIKTRGSGGDDSDWNLANLCRWCHSRLHQLGQVRFANKEPRYMELLIKKGWFIENGKLRNQAQQTA